MKGFFLLGHQGNEKEIREGLTGRIPFFFSLGTHPIVPVMLGAFD
jgi:hypothetical protein